MGDVNSWELNCAPVVGMFLLFPVVSLGGCKSLGWRRPLTCCHVLCLCVSGSTTVFAVGCCYAVGFVGYSSILCVKPVLSPYCG